ncbi:hypothetical protein [Acidithiobacillus sp. AMEEHan]|uniref:hypothetical protein n=1 Tax=Acidithiobacillus sp. AMEEHan TaxID=2994951 RepID=UPI0027E3F7DE|nr:hypothetical protein [Acidithiobacillus sp. AMEEHan]
MTFHDSPLSDAIHHSICHHHANSPAILREPKVVALFAATEGDHKLLEAARSTPQEAGHSKRRVEEERSTPEEAHNTRVVPPARSAQELQAPRKRQLVLLALWPPARQR